MHGMVTMFILTLHSEVYIKPIQDRIKVLE